MPRLSNEILRHAYTINPFVTLLLRTCRLLPSAHNELRWIRQHVDTRLESKFGSKKDIPGILRRKCIVSLVKKRARGEPLQYLLGSQPFGDLDILCKKGVLIPRQATEEYTHRLARVLLSSPAFNTKDANPIHILDLCTGTGCIPLLLLNLLSPTRETKVTGVDISPLALSLARRNTTRNSPLLPTAHTRFAHGDVLASGPAILAEAQRARQEVGWWYGDQMYDVVTANPPYISREGYNRDTERSVRNYEPRLALVPGGGRGEAGEDVFPEDVFYERIVERAERVGARVVLMEVAGTAQAKRVAGMVRERDGWGRVEIWRDFPDGELDEGNGGRGREERLVGEDGGAGEEILFRGVGEGRAVVCWRST